MKPQVLKSLSVAAALTLALSACGSSEPEAAEGEPELLSAGNLTVCTDAPYKPFEYPDKASPTGYTGFDMEIIDAIAAEMDLEVTIKDAGFDGLQSGASLAAGQCDLVASAMTITEEREANLDFSEPYYDSKQSLLAEAGSDIASIDDLDGTKVGVQQGTTGAQYAKDNVPEGAELVSFPSDAELYAALSSGGVQAVLQDLPVNLEHTDDGNYEIVEEYDTDESYGFAVKEDGSEDLLAAINDNLQALRDSGDYDTIYEKYFSTE
ncbi:Glutamine-binding periplasmic protein precursor [Nocardioides dokdonensis FR1436]|uniref:Glutamine-binding periplasmic protein n=1 Tax=Nocardioides dokdonensis FR1436 TaxID=1300347 RepID=A0A1A9GJL0_9ACTN|nr:transporter substrate-binding domain-containing protein [Nocardioides dokdonensis]ANH37852.1 Glutamine-binding periplasmic protein precursor [Nocardioides dokdonensis FR1436]